MIFLVSCVIICPCIAFFVFGNGGGGGGVSSGDEKGCIGVDHNKNHLICL